MTDNQTGNLDPFGLRIENGFLIPGYCVLANRINFAEGHKMKFGSKAGCEVRNKSAVMLNSSAAPVGHGDVRRLDRPKGLEIGIQEARDSLLDSLRARSSIAISESRVAQSQIVVDMLPENIMHEAILGYAQTHNSIWIGLCVEEIGNDFP
ncbi:hypothetical protein HG530_009088 [Fusarium avenaceum]|nr:hypothetical protein HG530_009088 [Fusarium avenaceum]